MKNNFIKIILILLLSVIYTSKVISDDFIFNISELEITENGNVYNGINGGKVTTDNGIEITSDNFKYNKLTTLLESSGNAILFDKIKNITIKSEQIFYLKNKELAYTIGKSSAVSGEEIEINSNEYFRYNKLSAILEAKGDVKIFDKIKNIMVESEKVLYFKNEDKFSTKGKTKANIEDKYFINTRDLTLLRKNMLLSSQYKTTIADTLNNFYTLNDFSYLINEEILKGNKVEVVTDYQQPDSDKYFFNIGFFDFKKQNFSAKDVKINFNKEMFDEKENDPRLRGVSATGNEFYTYLSKGNFTTCKKKISARPGSLNRKKLHSIKLKNRLFIRMLG